jgi:phosphohistidine swiveling domain-containing protein
MRAGAPVLPGWVVPCAQSRPALAVAAAAVRGGDPAAARRAALSCPLDPTLRDELAVAVAGLGGRVIVRSSSPLEHDPLWSGAFSSIAEVGPQDAETAVRSCWAAAFAADPLARLEASGLAPEALELALVIQPELRPDAGGTARANPRSDGDVEVDVEGVAGHPGAMLAGWAEGVSARLRVSAALAGQAAPPAREATLSAGFGLAGIIGPHEAGLVAWLAARIHLLLGDNTIEWAVLNGEVFLLQSTASRVKSDSRHPGVTVADPDTDQGKPGEYLEHLAAREWMPLLAAAVRVRGRRLRGRPAAAGTAAGRLVPCQPHERPAASCVDAILLVDHPLPSLAPLLFGTRGLIARTGAASSHLAQVARSLAVPMVTGCQAQAVIGDGPHRASWLAAIDGTTGEVALLPE